MRKAEKRRLGEERARVYQEQEDQRLAEQLKQANQIRAEKARDRADIVRRRKAGKAMRGMAVRRTYTDEMGTI